ncbi:MAG: hypothetical protein ACI350_10825 [Prevotella sp.]
MADQYNQQPERLTNLRERVPDKVCILLYLCYLTAFQFSNGFYFTTMAQLAGERDLTPSDTHMFGQTVLTGLCFYFPLAFRLKFRFTNKTSLTIAACGLLAVNLLFPHVHSYALMLALCYIGGFFRLYGTFECFSNLLPRVTPTYNYAVFLSFVFFVVIGCVGLFDWLAIRIIYYFDWQHIHLAAAGLCAVVIVLVQVFMRPFRTMPKMPLLGIDLLGMLLWTVFILSALFAVCYGEEYDWMADRRIRLATGISILSLAVCFLRMNHIRHPFIEYGAFRSPNLLILMLLFLALDLFTGAQNVLQNCFMGSIMGYDQLTASQLKWPEFMGAGVAALFCLVARSKMGWHLKTLTFWSMAAMVGYSLLMAWLVWAGISISQLWIPSFLFGFGHVGVFIALTVYAQAYTNFKYYFQVLCVLGFIRMGLSDAIGIAVWEHALQGETRLHLVNMGVMNAHACATLTPKAMTAMGTEALITSIRELYGWATVAGTAILTIILAAHFDSLRNPLPKLRQAYMIIRKKENS